jgi:hypothetical protein
MLLPLIEMVFGRSFLGSSGKSTGWRDPLSSRHRSGPRPMGMSRRADDLRSHDRNSSSSTAADSYGDLELGTGVPCRTKISTSPDGRIGDSEESIFRDEDPSRIVRRDQVTVEYETREEKDANADPQKVGYRF